MKFNFNLHSQDLVQLVQKIDALNQQSSHVVGLMAYSSLEFVIYMVALVHVSSAYHLVDELFGYHQCCPLLLSTCSFSDCQRKRFTGSEIACTYFVVSE